MSDGRVQILLVEGDPEERRAAVRALARTGWAVTEAVTAADALAVLRRGGDFIVLLALALPDMDGRDLLARIAADHPDTPAVIVTGVDDVAVAIDAMQRGAWDYVVGRADGSPCSTSPTSSPAPSSAAGSSYAIASATARRWKGSPSRCAARAMAS